LPDSYRDYDYIRFLKPKQTKNSLTPTHRN
ncbi:MAG: hypothetical protein ACI85O_002117, partial [Saprospiraceae bacterium]